MNLLIIIITIIIIIRIIIIIIIIIRIIMYIFEDSAFLIYLGYGIKVTYRIE